MPRVMQHPATKHPVESAKKGRSRIGSGLRRWRGVVSGPAAPGGSVPGRERTMPRRVSQWPSSMAPAMYIMDRSTKTRVWMKEISTLSR